MHLVGLGGDGTMLHSAFSEQDFSPLVPLIASEKFLPSPAPLALRKGSDFVALGVRYETKYWRTYFTYCT